LESGESYLMEWYSEVWEFQFHLALGILFRSTVVLSRTVSAILLMRKIPYLQNRCSDEAL
jgi:hypothetical protein